MRLNKGFLFLIFIIFFFGKSASAQTDPNFVVINNLDFDYYLNKPIDSLLAAIPSFQPSQTKIYGALTDNNAKKLVITYPNQVELVVRPKRFQYMNPIDPARVWDFSLFRKETAWVIELYYDGKEIKDSKAH